LNKKRKKTGPGSLRVNGEENLKHNLLGGGAGEEKGKKQHHTVRAPGGEKGCLGPRGKKGSSRQKGGLTRKKF